MTEGRKMITTLATAPNGEPFTTKPDAITSRSAPFAWSPELQAFTVYLANGHTVIVLDSQANRDAVQRALTGAPGDITPPPGPSIVVVQPPPEEK